MDQTNVLVDLFHRIVAARPSPPWLAAGSERLHAAAKRHILRDRKLVRAIVWRSNNLSRSGDVQLYSSIGTAQ